MRAEDAQAKATIVAALITARVVELPRLSGDPARPPDQASLRMRQLTDCIYDAIIAGGWPEERSADA